MLRRPIYTIFLMLVAGLAIVSVLLAYELNSSRPRRAGEIKLAGLQSPLTVRFDRFGIPDISAASRRDAAFALGFVTAGDRLFQMDLIRRKSGGRLAEIFGEAALENDIRQRHLDIEAAAQRIVDALPLAQRESLEAYALGVNAYLEQTANLPPEFILLQYEPARWTARDSILVVLSMFQLLSWSESEERLLSVMHECLPQPVTSFLTPDTDGYTKVLTGGPDSARPVQAIPVRELAAVLEHNRTLETSVRVGPADEHIGSNNWAVNSRKTLDGSAMLANDMHLPVSVPNIWYRATMRYAGLQISGLNLPGVPSIVAGSNGHVAWGFTNFMADVMDLPKLTIHPDHTDRYWTSSGWRKLESIPQSIRVKGAAPLSLDVKISLWGPVWRETLLGQPVAIRWTALDPAAVDLALMELDRVRSIEEGISLLNRAGAPPQNVLLADDRGNIAWSLMGRIPRRVEGFDGSMSRSWAQKSNAWIGFLDPDELPRIINPPSGFLATANSRNVGRDYPHVLGHNFAHGYRTFRISEALEKMHSVTEMDLFRLQLDTKTDFYEFYRTLASGLLTTRIVTRNPVLADLKREIDAWDGFARVDSRGLPFLAAFRTLLAERVFGPILKSCASMDPAFEYNWYELETPLRQLLNSQIPDTLPDSRFDSWNHFLLAILEESAGKVTSEHSLATFQNFTWGEFRDIPISHPLSPALPWLAELLDMPNQRFDGCAFCIRVMSRQLSASERFVISPGRPERGILHMPGGQSGHLLSSHYADQHPYWAKGLAMPYRSEQADTVLRLVP
ncbi:MAG: penicillin acylase family protein [Methylococcaceae bacterium]|nr:penicillin acylase family protein [Methylococcaceae bacterium]MCI0668349.1 penicillin acylase family protein [Methylococcaceae bacterium]MCI0733139.1 penicillin acylase family protein [Methylococcaceae bacterium]